MREVIIKNEVLNMKNLNRFKVKSPKGIFINIWKGNKNRINKSKVYKESLNPWEIRNNVV